MPDCMDMHTNTWKKGEKRDGK